MGKKIVTTTLCALIAMIISCATGPGYVPPNTKKGCVQTIYQTGSSKPSFESFNQSLSGANYDSTPGIGYNGGRMHACADGIVTRIETLDTGRLGGEMVTVSHGGTISTMYAHLGKLYVSEGQTVSRGDRIGDPESAGKPKLMISVRYNWENPDDWGPNHSLMADKDSYKETPDRSDISPLHKLKKQYEIIEFLYKKINVPKQEWLYRKHNPYRRFGAVARWSLVNHMRYLRCQMETEPEKFTIDFQTFLKNEQEFYEHQPVILTTPK